MSLPNAVQGARLPSLKIRWRNMSLAGKTVTARIEPVGGAARNADGVFTLVPDDDQAFYWQFGATDIGTAGTFLVQFKATEGSAYALSEPVNWTVLEAL